MNFIVICPECRKHVWADNLAYHCLNEHRDNAVKVYDEIRIESNKKLKDINNNYRKIRMEEKERKIKEIEEEYK